MKMSKITRRDALKLGLATVAVTALPATAVSYQRPNLFKLPELPYPTEALAPVIDAATMKIHHTKHHQTYVDKLNAALEKEPSCQRWSLEDLLQRLADVPESIRGAVRNHGGGHHNHTLFWESMKPPRQTTGSKPEGPLQEALTRDFGSFEGFQTQFQDAGLALFGSGWVWLAWDQAAKKLTIATTANQDSLLFGPNLRPLLGNDVWEHAYYLSYQNRRADYLKAWWGVVNWDVVAKRLKAQA